MKTKILIPGLLAALMLVTVPIITVAVTEKPDLVTVNEIPKLKEIPSEDSTFEEPTVEETTVEEPTKEKTTAQHREYISFGFIKASFSGIQDNEVDFDRGLFLTKNIKVTTAKGTLTKPLKVNGKTVVESRTQVELEIKVMSNLGFRLYMDCMTGGIPRYQLSLSGFASGISVTF